MLSPSCECVNGAIGYIILTRHLVHDTTHLSPGGRPRTPSTRTATIWLLGRRQRAPKTSERSGRAHPDVPTSSGERVLPPLQPPPTPPRAPRAPIAPYQPLMDARSPLLELRSRRRPRPRADPPHVRPRRRTAFAPRATVYHGRAPVPAAARAHRPRLVWAALPPQPPPARSNLILNPNPSPRPEGRGCCSSH